MYAPSHIAAGLVIGKITGDYTTAVIASIFPDTDHAYAFFKHGYLKNWKKFVNIVVQQEDPFDDQRNYLHNIFVAVALSVIAMIINLQIGVIITVAYFLHLLMDALDGAEYYPFYPKKKINLKGPIGYFSKYDMAVSIVLIIIFLVL
ncbi:MAG: metal-dependent hydrolase [Candidatus Komeilibacteria bacterium]